MPFIKAGRCTDDPFVRVADDAPIPGNRPVLVSADVFLAAAADLARRSAPVGVIWPNHRPIAELAPYLARLALVALVFPSFRDGRAYSQAYLLRNRYRYRGELRATGEVLRDQFSFLARAGFDAFEAKKDADAAAFAVALTRFSVVYQPSADEQISAFRQRLSGGLHPDIAVQQEAVS